MRVGFPIRISTDQRLLAAPRGFSQRATSFIASWCQGIHRMPFSCLRSGTPFRAFPTHLAHKPYPGTFIPRDGCDEAGLELSTHGAPLRGAPTLLNTVHADGPSSRMNTVGQTYVRGCAQERTRTYSLVQRSNITGDENQRFRSRTFFPLRQTEPPSRPSACADGGDDRVRTDDPLLAKQVLSQLSYVPGTSTDQSRAPGTMPGQIRRVVGQGGFEPPTPRLSSVCSNQLSY